MRIEHAPEIEAPLVFVGYGLTVPEEGHDDLAGLDLKGKVALHFTGGPENIPGPLLAHYQSTGERWKFLEKAGALGVVAIRNPRGQDIPWERAALARFQPAMELTDPALADAAGQKLSVTFHPESATRFFEESGYDYAELLAAAQARKPLPRFPVPVSIAATVPLIETARILKESATRPRRSIVFVAVTGEEKGLLGSRHYAAHPTVPEGSMVANLNNDMFSPFFPLKSLVVQGLEESDLASDLKRAASSVGVEVLSDPEPERNAFVRSDQYSFIREGIPALSLKVGFTMDSPEHEIVRTWRKERYHAPSDDLNQPVDLEAAAAGGRPGWGGVLLKPTPPPPPPPSHRAAANHQKKGALPERGAPAPGRKGLSAGVELDAKPRVPELRDRL